MNNFGVNIIISITVTSGAVEFFAQFTCWF